MKIGTNLKTPWKRQTIRLEVKPRCACVEPRCACVEPRSACVDLRFACVGPRCAFVEPRCACIDPRNLQLQNILKVREVGWRQNSIQDLLWISKRPISKNPCRRSKREPQEWKQSCIDLETPYFFWRKQAQSTFAPNPDVPSSNPDLPGFW